MPATSNSFMKSSPVYFDEQIFIFFFPTGTKALKIFTLNEFW